MLLVLGVLFVYAWALTHIASTFSLPTPHDVAAAVGLSEIPYVWGDDGLLRTNLRPSPVREDVFEREEQRLLIFGIMAGCFLCAYFLPLGRKRPAIALWFLVGFTLLFGVAVAAWFCAMHLGIYLIFHPDSDLRRPASYAFGGLLALGAGAGQRAVLLLPLIVVTAVASAGFFHLVVRRSLQNRRIASAVRLAAVQSPWLVTVAGVISQGIEGGVWVLPLGLILFFFQWERLMMYHADYNDGEVPHRLALGEYLSIFMSPGLLMNGTWSGSVGQGYSYLSNRFLSRDKNAIALSGIRILCLALFYTVMGMWILVSLITFLEWASGVTVYANLVYMLDLHRRGVPMSTGTVLLTTLFAQISILIKIGAITHFRVGVWRLLGYQVEPQYNYFWLATDLSSLWRRFNYHYREFLVRCFYYPVFFRFFKNNLTLRIFAATLVATIVGNHMWGHGVQSVIDQGWTLDVQIQILRRWPYFLLLGTTISLTQVYLLRWKRKRKPWTLDWKLPLDFVYAYLTFQFFSLIHVYTRPHADMSLWDTTRLFLKGFGIHLAG